MEKILKVFKWLLQWGNTASRHALLIFFKVTISIAFVAAILVVAHKPIGRFLKNSFSSAIKPEIVNVVQEANGAIIDSLDQSLDRISRKVDINSRDIQENKEFFQKEFKVAERERRTIIENSDEKLRILEGLWNITSSDSATSRLVPYPGIMDYTFETDPKKNSSPHLLTDTK